MSVLSRPGAGLGGSVCYPTRRRIYFEILSRSSDQPTVDRSVGA